MTRDGILFPVLRTAMRPGQAFPSLHLSLSEPSPHAWPICLLVTTQDSVQLALPT